MFVFLFCKDPIEAPAYRAGIDGIKVNQRCKHKHNDALSKVFVFHIFSHIFPPVMTIQLLLLRQHINTYVSKSVGRITRVRKGDELLTYSIWELTCVLCVRNVNFLPHYLR